LPSGQNNIDRLIKFSKAQWQALGMALGDLTMILGDRHNVICEKNSPGLL
jgi:hypothetical protein